MGPCEGAEAQTVKDHGMILAKRYLGLVALLIVIALALAVRMYGLDWDRGMAFTPHPDERAILFKVAELSPPELSNFASFFDSEESTWNPKWFAYGSFPLYALRGVQLVSEAIGTEIVDLRITGRAISGLADMITLFIVYLLASRIYNRRVGLVAAGFLAVAVLHIQLSHFFAVDTVQTMFAAASLFFMYRVAREGGIRNSALAGLFIGLGLATKASQVPICLAFGVAHIMYLFNLAGRSENSPIDFSVRLRLTAYGAIAGMAVALAAFFITQPYALLDWTRYKSDLTEQSEMVRRLLDYPYTRQYADTLPYWYFIKQNAVWGLGLPLGILAWCGTLFVTVRGLNWRHALGYVGFGLLLPGAILVWSHSLMAVAIAAVIAIAGLLISLPLRRSDTRIEVLFLAWVIPYFLITGSFEVKFMRYLIPITPFLILFGSSFAFAMWREGESLWRRVLQGRYFIVGRSVMVGIALFITAATGFYAFSYLSVYSEPHTAVRASDWINENVRATTVVLKEHWEEGLPNMHTYRVNELPMYDPDGPPKLEFLSEKLATAETLVFFSDRLYGTLPRMPDRYGASAAYYRLLFSGQLGYELVNYQATYPSFLGVSFLHDTFSRPQLPEPEPLQSRHTSAISIALGHADESFSVYDHPTVLVFRNEGKYSADKIRKLIDSNTPVSTLESVTPNGPMLSEDEFARQREGGTWTEIFAPDRWTSKVPVLTWLIVVQGLALLALPLTMWIMRPLPDRGYLFSKAVGILLVSIVVWLLASFHWITFSSRAIAFAAVVLSAMSAVVLIYHRESILSFVKRRWSLILISEAVFLVAFLVFLALRMANPDLWHPFRGGEKPMDLAYLNAVIRSTIMPPLDPWFAGGFINYYYFGQFITALLVKATAIDVRVAYNLAVASFFAITAGGAFSLVYNLAESSRRRLLSEVRVAPSRDHETSSVEQLGLKAAKRSQSSSGPIWAGLIGVAFVAVLGNLDGAIQVGHGLVNVVKGMPFGNFDFWQSSRMMPPDPPGFEITEFPFFTFLFADLHAHLMSLPFTLLALGLCLTIVLKPSRFTLPWMARLCLLGIVVGALRVINTWDYPTYLIVSIVAVFLAGYFRQGGMNLAVAARAIGEASFVFLVGYLIFLPFHLRYETFFSSVEATTNKTVLWQFLAISGLPIFILGSFYLKELWSLRGPTLRQARRDVAGLGRRSLGLSAFMNGSEDYFPMKLLYLFGLAVCTVAVVSLLFIYQGSTVPFLIVILAVVLVVGVVRLMAFGPIASIDAFVAVIVGLSLALAIGLDFFRIEGDIDRMNTLFKTYLQIWVMLGLGSAYALWRLLHTWKPKSSDRVPLICKRAWLLVLILIVAGGSIYPIMGSHDRLRDRFQSDHQPLTLDGMAYMEDATFTDEMGSVDLVHDYEAIIWIQRNLKGTPVIAEAHTPTYRWGNRVSIYTGLPSVVGWRWHQEQQRWDYRRDIAQRIFQLNTLYETDDPDRALQVIDRYGVEYVYVGELEKRYYPEEGIAKFEGSMRSFLDPVYSNSEVTIYRVIAPQ